MPFEMDSTISIHAPRKGGDFDQSTSPMYLTISIHAPREGGDVPEIVKIESQYLFQSTPPARGATFAASSAFFATFGFQSTPPARGGTQLQSQQGAAPGS